MWTERVEECAQLLSACQHDCSFLGTKTCYRRSTVDRCIMGYFVVCVFDPLNNGRIIRDFLYCSKDFRGVLAATNSVFDGMNPSLSCGALSSLCFN